jgi:hypothetical protein
VARAVLTRPVGLANRLRRTAISHRITATKVANRALARPFAIGGGAQDSDRDSGRADGPSPGADDPARTFDAAPLGVANGTMSHEPT